MSNPFEMLGLHPELVRAVAELGYETPTPIQEGAIPALLEGRDLLGQAQTGTGKTAAFGLPMLQQLDFGIGAIQGLILTPTRELAIQVAEAVSSYGEGFGLRVLPIYGGQAYSRQIKRLQSGVHIVVGTPGRTIDLIKQGALELGAVRFVVLDEADEMLSMGFVEDVETILNETPIERQTALFSATLPSPIRRLAERYLREPLLVAIAHKTLTVPQTEQRYYLLREGDKLAALARLLEVEDFTSVLIFTRTKIGAAELAEALLGRGYPAEAIHGDLTQDAREIVLRRFRNGQLQLLVATDVVARGMDIQGVSHVINYDIPGDAEDYVHRIGRTGRAGHSGIAITLVTPRERRWLKAIETFTRQPIARAALPTPSEIHARRDARFAASIGATLADTDLNHELALIGELMAAGYDVTDIAAAAVRLARGYEAQRPIDDLREVREYAEHDTLERRPKNGRPKRSDRTSSKDGGYEPGMVRLLMNLGKEHGVRPSDIVGAIAGEAGIPGKAIGAIDIRKQETFVDVSEVHVEKVLHVMKRSKLRGQLLTLRRVGDHSNNDVRPKRKTERKLERLRKSGKEQARELLEL
jgi:ATP-dependent RNA helicase DeaD